MTSDATAAALAVPRAELEEPGTAARDRRADGSAATSCSSDFTGSGGFCSSARHRAQHRAPAGRRPGERDGAQVGYNAELERAMSSPDGRDATSVTPSRHSKVASAALRPGVTCADVDGAVMRCFEDNDLSNWRQHAGQRWAAEPRGAVPRPGHTTTIEPGMVFTIEPGVYDSAIGGFRHSGHRRGDARRDRDSTDPARPREPDDPALSHPAGAGRRFPLEPHRRIRSDGSTVGPMG